MYVFECTTYYYCLLLSNSFYLFELPSTSQSVLKIEACSFVFFWVSLATMGSSGKKAKQSSGISHSTAFKQTTLRKKMEKALHHFSHAMRYSWIDKAIPSSIWRSCLVVLDLTTSIGNNTDRFCTVSLVYILKHK